MKSGRLVALMVVIVTGKALADDPFDAFATQYCIRCHGPEKQKGQLTLHDMEPDFSPGLPLERWRLIEEQIRFHDMPPGESEQPSAEERKRMLSWIRARQTENQRPNSVTASQLLLPEFGNHVDHDILFNRKPGPVVPASPGLWRIRPEIYRARTDGLSRSKATISRPFPVRGGATFRDYGGLSFVDESATDLLLRNAERVVLAQAGQPEFATTFRVLQPDTQSDQEQMLQAIRLEFRLALRREPTREEQARFLKLWKKNFLVAESWVAARATLMTILMQPEFLFRLELGDGEPDARGRLRLSPVEVARALSYALRNSIDDRLMSAAEKGRLTSRDQVAVTRSSPEYYQAVRHWLYIQ
ncbi:MAG: DUF1592 domain-containing protein [Verrucomicrobiota bacterium]